MLEIFEPAAEEVLSLGPPVTLRGWAVDPTDGDIPERIAWQVDGQTVGVGSSLNAGVLALGQHALSATVTNPQALITSVTESFSVSTSPPQVTIDSAAGGASFGTDELIVLRGESRDFQGDLSPSALAWNIAGANVGTGVKLSTAIVATGDKVIQLTATSITGLVASASVTVHISPATGKPSTEITIPNNNAGFEARLPDDTLADHSQPIAFSAKVTDASAKPISATVTWSSDVDGLLGTGTTILRSLSGGPCGITLHKITATATNSAGSSATDAITLQVWQTC